ncbi:MAG: hypothetical protein ACREOI_15655 [bacterium]
MSIFRGRAQQALTAFLPLFLILAFLLVQANVGLADVPKNKKHVKGKGSLSKTATVDQITPFDANRIYNYIVNNGDIVTDNVGGHSGLAWPSVPRTNRQQTEDELIGSNTADYSSGLWIVGTVNDSSRSAIVEYTSEFIAGKILPNGQRDNGTLPKYRVYKIIKGDGPGVTDWDEWPAADGAPTNLDGTPRLIGDQTLWFVMNDMDAARHQGPIAGSPPMGLEVQTTVFGFNRADPLGDVMFVQWKIINRGTANIDSAFIGVWDDPDLGDAADDLVGSDVNLGLGFCYNGDPNDGQYGARTPALGFDFFQGPEVPKGSRNYLKMTSFAKYTNGAPTGRGDPVNVAEVYNYMTGFWANGDPFIDPTTGQATKFIHAGDPATHRGDLDFSPSDRRFLMSSGPFTLAMGDTQVVVGAKILAPGANPSSSIAALRFFDSFAQSAFDNDFEVVNAPAPSVAVRRLDQEIVLTWLDGFQQVENFQEKGYTFQGYRVYQASSLTGPYTNIATYDVADGLQNIFDLQFDEGSGLVVERPVVIAADAGIQRYISIKTDAIFNANQRLSNYRDYYFAVTAYVANVNATPRVIESSITTFKVAPTAADYGTSVRAESGARANFSRATGSGDGEFYRVVVDPTLLVDATYTIMWNDDSTPDAQAYTWNLAKNGVPVLTNQPVTPLDSEGNVRRDIPVVDGFQPIMVPGVFINPPEFILRFDQTANPNSATTITVNGGSAFSGIPNDRVNGFYGSGGTSDLAALQADLELRFTGVRVVESVNDTTIVSGGQLAVMSSNANNAFSVVRVPFELWDIERNVQLNMHIRDRNANAGNPSPWGNNGAPLYCRFGGRAYVSVINAPYNEAALTPTSFTRNDPNGTWFIWMDGASRWETGDRVVVQFSNPVFPTVDTYTFTTQKSVVTGQTAIAKEQLQKINIVPNPYWAFNPGERDPINRFVRLTNLPGSGATVRIFTLAGELVRVINDAVRSADGTNGLQYANWDLRNDAGIPVASGVYIVHVEVPNVGTVVRKAVVMMPEERLDVF